MRPESQAEPERIMAGFRQECLRVLNEAGRFSGTRAEAPEGWPAHFAPRVYAALLKYQEEIEAAVEEHLTAEERT